jgi:succinyl-diaminopimelate desuccinylase
MTTDPVELTAALVRCPSVTPAEGGALALLQDRLAAAGFDCARVDRNGTPNLFARAGRKGAPRSFGFNGHTDVVPPGDPALWSADPFGAAIRDGTADRFFRLRVCERRGADPGLCVQAGDLP